MRYDLNILWVEDYEDFYKQNSEMLEMKAEDLGLKIRIDYVQNARELLDKIKNSSLGFRLYDMLFVDYSLSHGIVGDTVIKELRKNELDADILFYSSQLEEEMKRKITEDLDEFQGVYIANREVFFNSAVNLVQKNAKRLLSLKNIRGMLMDQTSENDYTITSYIMKRFGDLNPEQQQTICEMVKTSINSHLKEFGKTQQCLTELDEHGIKNIKNTLRLANYLLPISLKYQIFKTMIEFLKEDAFNTFTLDTYINNTIKKRNLLAHKKLELSVDQRFILYYDHIDQYQTVQHEVLVQGVAQSVDNKISLEDWKEIRRQVVGIGACFDEVQKKLYARNK